MKEVIIDFKTAGTVALSPVEDTVYRLQVDGGNQGPRSLTVTLEKPDVSVKILCGHKSTEEKSLDLSTTVIHQAPRTHSEILIRCVLFDKGISSYRGKIVMQNIAPGSSSRLDDRTLVVGNGTRNHSEPIMQIETNDVTASHASSTGRVDENQLYYLQTRGLTVPESQDLLIKAFLNPTP